MSFINLNKIDDFNVILNSDIYISHDPILKNKEAIENMWCIPTSDIRSAHIKKSDLENLINQLLLLRQCQITKKEIIGPITFYIWVDEMASQLRFSFISGCGIDLPFMCKTIEVHSLFEIIDMLFNADMEEEVSMNNDVQKDFYLIVFRKCLT